MSNHLISLAYKADVGTILRKAVLVLLADKAADDGAGIWASKQTMADELCCSKQSILNTLRQFEADGLIKETGQRDHQNGYTVEYQISVKALEALPKVARWAGDQSKRLTGQPRLPLNRVDRKGSKGLTQTIHSTSSEANASVPADAGTADPAKQLFDFGVSLLTGAGMTETQARSLIGKWRKAKDDGAVLTGLIECRNRDISNPVEWLQRRFQAAKYVSASGYEYRGSLEQIRREAERRNDMATYWAVQKAMREDKAA